MAISQQILALAPRKWIAPRLIRLGTIADVAANANVLTAQNANRS